MYWGYIIIWIIIFVIFIFSLFFGVKTIIKYWKVRKTLHLVLGIILIGIFTITAALITALLTGMRLGVPEGCEDWSSPCTTTNIEITNVVNTADNNYYITLMATSLDEETKLGGEALVFNDLSDSNDIHYISNQEYPINEIMQNITIPIKVNTENNVKIVYVVAYFLDSSGNKQLCSNANNYTLL